MISPCTQDVSIYHLLEYSEPLSAFICMRMPRTRLMNLIFWNCCSCQLKCGGRTPGLEARRVLHASAMSNWMSYVALVTCGPQQNEGKQNASSPKNCIFDYKELYPQSNQWCEWHYLGFSWERTVEQRSLVTFTGSHSNYVMVSEQKPRSWTFSQFIPIKNLDTTHTHTHTPLPASSFVALAASDPPHMLALTRHFTLSTWATWGCWHILWNVQRGLLCDFYSQQLLWRHEYFSCAFLLASHFPTSTSSNTTDSADISQG